jgi:hypothetical protein
MISARTSSQGSLVSGFGLFPSLVAPLLTAIAAAKDHGLEQNRRAVSEVPMIEPEEHGADPLGMVLPHPFGPAVDIARGHNALTLKGVPEVTHLRTHRGRTGCSRMATATMITTIIIANAPSVAKCRSTSMGSLRRNSR